MTDTSTTTDPNAPGVYREPFNRTAIISLLEGPAEKLPRLEKFHLPGGAPHRWDPMNGVWRFNLLTGSQVVDIVLKFLASPTLGFPMLTWEQGVKQLRIKAGVRLVKPPLPTGDGGFYQPPPDMDYAIISYCTHAWAKERAGDVLTPKQEDNLWGPISRALMGYEIHRDPMIQMRIDALSPALREKLQMMFLDAGENQGKLNIATKAFETFVGRMSRTISVGAPDASTMFSAGLPGAEQLAEDVITDDTDLSEAGAVPEVAIDVDTDAPAAAEGGEAQAEPTSEPGDKSGY